MARVTDKDIENFNVLYIKYGTYAEVARQTGFSPTTVKKYIKSDFVPSVEVETKIFFVSSDFPETFNNEMFEGIDNYGELCVLSEEEKIEIMELWKELAM